MSILTFTAAYFRQYRKLMIILCLFAAVFAAVFYLYRIELEAIFYAFLLCSVAGIILLGLNFQAAYKKHLRLRALCKVDFPNPRELPVASEMHDMDYAALIEKLWNHNYKQLNEFNQSRRDMEEYYTLWAHQIKSPVAAMRLLLQSEDNFQSQELLLELFKIEQYVEMVLSYIRLDSESSDFVIGRYSLNKILRVAVRKYAPLFIRKKLSLDMGDISLEVLTDEKWLTFVVEQVLSNALKYTNSGKISIYTEGFCLVIGDSGIGIAAEDLPRVGQKGFTGYNGRSHKKATGIGLFLCKTICTKLGHSLSLESEVGVGTRVYIGLDCAPTAVE